MKINEVHQVLDEVIITQKQLHSLELEYNTYCQKVQTSLNEKIACQKALDALYCKLKKEIENSCQ